jgi:hypothetical protein
MSMARSFQTQRVTAVDLRAGRIRVPHDTKALLPSTRGSVSIVLRGEPMVVAYDPRMGPDRERSGVLSIGRGLADKVRPDEVLTVSWTGESLTID